MTTLPVETALSFGAIAPRLRQSIEIAERYATPVLDLIIRLWIARVFFTSGLTKLRDRESTVFLFEYEYMVPVLSPQVAAALATMVEVGAPILIAVGLFSRVAALPLLGMTLVIQFVLGAATPAYANVEHYYWMMLLGLIILHGPGRLSIDRWHYASVFYAATRHSPTDGGHRARLSHRREPVVRAP